MAYRAGRCLLREQLEKNGMTQLDLALKLGVTVQQINKYVRNKQGMSLQVAKNVASILNCRVEDLYEWVEAGQSE